MNEDQENVIINFMSGHSKLAAGQLIGNEGVRNKEDQWIRVQGDVNKRGPFQTVDQVKAKWNCLKSTAKEYSANKNVYKRMTGNPVETSFLKDDKLEDVLNVVGKSHNNGLAFGRELGVPTVKVVLPKQEKLKIDNMARLKPISNKPLSLKAAMNIISKDRATGKRIPLKPLLVNEQSTNGPKLQNINDSLPSTSASYGRDENFFEFPNSVSSRQSIGQLKVLNIAPGCNLEQLLKNKSGKLRAVPLTDFEVSQLLKGESASTTQKLQQQQQQEHSLDTVVDTFADRPSAVTNKVVIASASCSAKKRQSVVLDSQVITKTTTKIPALSTMSSISNETLAKNLFPPEIDYTSSITKSARYSKYHTTYNKRKTVTDSLVEVVNENTAALRMYQETAQRAIDVEKERNEILKHYYTEKLKRLGPNNDYL